MPLFSRFAAILAVAAGMGLAQTGQTKDPSFDAASIKPAKPGARGYSIQPLPGRVSAQNVTLNLLIAEAYHVYDFQISGGPKWADGDRFDVEAKAAGQATPSRSELRAMLRSLLAERFGLTIHHGNKEMQVLVLEPAKGGVKLQASTHAESPTLFRVFQRRQITAENAPLDYLTEALTWLMGKPVLDHSGLAATYDYKLEWAPDELQVQAQEAPPQTDGSAPSLNTALQQQMGLRLVSKKDAVDLIAVDRAERPAAN